MELLELQLAAANVCLDGERRGVPAGDSTQPLASRRERDRFWQTPHAEELLARGIESRMVSIDGCSNLDGTPASPRRHTTLPGGADISIWLGGTPAAAENNFGKITTSVKSNGAKKTKQPGFVLGCTRPPPKSKLKKTGLHSAVYPLNISS